MPRIHPPRCHDMAFSRSCAVTVLGALSRSYDWRHFKLCTQAWQGRARQQRSRAYCFCGEVRAGTTGDCFSASGSSLPLHTE
eukprot:scaffold14582_cov108-Isochrysis_galbana.AAC.5